ncbi:MAG: DUF362 domain-containing protein [Desulfobacteraceae bacterium]|nr:DUF362 domain-containing protein [Desulfobacteraceae bacterium]
MGATGLAFWDRKGPGRFDSQTSSPLLPSFALPEKKPAMAVVRGNDRGKCLELAIKAIGGISSFIRPGDRVLLKVNAAFATPPFLGATTHPECVTHMTKLCLKAGAASVSVTDNPINDPVSCFELTGIAPGARSAGATVVLPTENQFETYTVPNGRLISNWPVLCKPLRQVNKVIGLAPVKDHHRSGASMTLKNWYGLLGGRRNLFHQQIHAIISELGQLIHPTLVILDGITSMMTNGPTGGSLDDLKATKTLIAGTDQVAVDSFGATLLGKTANDLPHLLMAQQAGIGTVDYQLLKPVMITQSSPAG